ncbi:hypothetical protein FQN57_002817 [Myotisia sp. PD_48]|nr:hypothetical protein FQN57_002817 [Myotisia sp. PD_48]
MSNPQGLHPRFEIRRLELEHLDWAIAVLCHTNIFDSPVWPAVYPDNLPGRLIRLFKTCEYFVRHQIESGLSFGVFDTEYKFKRTESESTGGKLYWDLTLDEGSTAKDVKETTSQEFLEQMDFPLVSIALSFDAGNPLDGPMVAPVIKTLPLFGTLEGKFNALDPRGDSESLQPKELAQVLKRNGTSTRRDYVGFGIMKHLAHRVMHEAARRGFQGIQIACMHDAVIHVWMNPPSPFKAQMLVDLNFKDFEEEEVEGRLINYSSIDQRASRIYVHLV